MTFLQRSKEDAFSQKWKEWIAFMCHGPESSAQCFVFFIQLLFLLDIIDWLYVMVLMFNAKQQMTAERCRKV